MSIQFCRHRVREHKFSLHLPYAVMPHASAARKGCYHFEMLQLDSRVTPRQTKNFEGAADWLMSFAVVGACTTVTILFRARLEPPTSAMLYLLGVILVSMRYRRSAAILNALLSVTAFYYFSVPFRDSFVIEDSNYILTLIAMLAVALVISSLTFKIRSQAADVLKAQIAIESERTRNSLLSAISHDIRTPLSAIYGAATSLLEEEERLDRSERHELIESIADESEHLNQVVTNLLEMTRLDAGLEIKRDWYPLEEIIGAALTRAEKVLRGRIVKTKIPADLPLICADDVLLEQLFINLLENASKYTPPGTRIEIAAIQHAQTIIIRVRDSGPGFPAGYEERIFEKFFRGKNDGIRGAGLGLAICKAIVQRHQGAIFADNSRGGGAVVTIELPIGGPPPAVGALPESSLT
jgi:K+-sensing histidine kinase KdpD